ncbi:putative formate dehydrogenase, beta subunit [Solidesulfovibrio carbinoliphilus subsp. oakridgensis]|uniref:Formate dehydrogenase, beta subunit n=1 Tax=Solidesulfovibrio carbinoliphilus subsp. oakridgensis TaxID=694327 RepID=G7Q4P6_9BACT|nr:4Fe-4S dicluster domain-containing protein [Solidesulfovibrio carbinoliphilus]EHJ47506.1 putative formate dehydrogenase, beta subunit [Solidesulfovibrio carbinoliphilus subsp. oakridgensis]
MPKTFFIDTSRCTACRGCQVACKEWHEHVAVPTRQRGTHQNPPDFTPQNFKIVRFAEHKIDGKIKWLFFPDQCRHCVSPPCKDAADAYVPGAILQDEATGAVLYTDKTKQLTIDQAREVQDVCPYHIPVRDQDSGLLTKCDWCIDRQRAGMLPACVKTCCTGAMSIGERADMLALARQTLAKVKETHPKAELLDEDFINVIYLVTEPRTLYHEYAERREPKGPMTRQAFLAMLARPVTRMRG